MNEELDKKSTLKELLTSKNGTKILILLGAVGMILILISEISSPNKKKNSNRENSINSFSQADYEEMIEKKIMEIVSHIDGVGKVKVMVTMKTSVEYVYAQDRTQKIESSEEEKVESQNKNNYSQNIDEKYIYVENSNGKKQALLITEILPEIKGVVVVCEGGGSVSVKSEIINAVTTVLGVYSNNVYVAKLAK